MAATRPVLLVLAALPLLCGVAMAAPADPPDDVLGWENGYWHNESLAVGDEPSDGELQAIASRAMARLEVLRGREFTEDVAVDVVDRSELGDGVGGGGTGDGGADGTANGTGNASDPSNASEWNNQVWEALFIVGEDRDVNELIGSETEGAVGGFYSHTEGGVTVVTDGERSIDVRTIVHELVHALQDQRYNLSASRFEPEVQDEQLAVRGLYEGEANYLRQRYVQRCGDEWSCVGGGDGGGGGSAPDNWGVFIVLFHPYSDGPAYVHDIVEAEGWSGVDERFREPPTASETVIHREDEPAVPIDYEDRSDDDWRLFREQGIDGYDVAGEASIFATFWYQSHPRFGSGVGAIDASRFRDADAGRYDSYDYTSAPSVGWGNDRIYPYRRGEDRGYVWVTRWDTARDARQFHEAYRRVLEGNGAESVRDGVWRIPDGRFADAFRVRRAGRNVTVVNAPTVEDLEDVRRPLPDGGRAANGDGRGGDDAGPDEDLSLLGAGAVAALLAMALVAVSARARRP